VSEEQPRVACREWTESPLALRRVFLGSSIAIGVAFIVLGPWVLTDDSAPGHLSGGICFIICGALLTSGGLFFLRRSARRVTLDQAGRFTFEAPSRSLAFQRGELRSVATLGLDPMRMMPMRVKSAKGSIFLSPGIAGSSELFEALQAMNPTARVENPIPWYSRNLVPH
jgi:hypothetical protein